MYVCAPYVCMCEWCGAIVTRQKPVSVFSKNILFCFQPFPLHIPFNAVTTTFIYSVVPLTSQFEPKFRHEYYVTPRYSPISYYFLYTVIKRQGKK